MEQQDKFITTKDIADLYGVKRKTVTNLWTKQPDFPKPAQRLSQKTVFWRLADIRAWRSVGGGISAPEAQQPVTVDLPSIPVDTPINAAPEVKELSQAKLLAMFSYDPDTGVVTSKRTGRPIGVENDRGYLVWNVNGKKYKLHRLIWMMVSGSWPSGLVDHKDGDKKNNRWSNLRDATEAVNSQNRIRARRDSSSGTLGVRTVDKDKHTAAIEIRVNGRRKTIYLGSHATPELAHEAYVSAKRKLHAGCTL